VKPLAVLSFYAIHSLYKYYKTNDKSYKTKFYGAVLVAVCGIGIFLAFTSANGDNTAKNNQTNQVKSNEQSSKGQPISQTVANTPNDSVTARPMNSQQQTNSPPRSLESFSSAPVSFPDKDFEVLIRSVVKKPSSSISKQDLARIKELRISSLDDVDIRGIDNLPNLQILYVHNLGSTIHYLKEIEKIDSLQLLVMSGSALSEADLRYILPKTAARAQIKYVNFIASAGGTLFE
jgi:hypothetical protein